MTYKEIRKNEEVRAYLKKGNENLGVLGYTDHSEVHCVLVEHKENYFLLMEEVLSFMKQF